ncbi:MAG: hypothetical protein KJO54_10335 [Gammaproteobacteria bacterium]|nr:hypothetical protein [Gammaproteobacteria bacterium]NNF61497.1 hypothetical protein [Gammaproteobacteria bacterium]
MARFRLRQIAHELMRRKVFRVAIGYMVVMWLFVQVAEVTFEPLQLPAWSLTLLIVFAIIGFPVAVILAWIFEVTPEGVQRDPHDTQPGAARDSARRDTDVRSVAVLPFADMSPEQDQRYFCEGIAEEILSLLCAVKCLQVPSRTSSFRFDAEIHDIREIGAALGVESILEGSIRKDEDKLRITAQLIDTKNGFHTWARTYDRQLSEVLAVQAELARDIVSQLCQSLSDAGLVIPEPASTADIQAYDYYLQGRYFLNRFSTQDTKFAVGLFGKALDLDPGFSRAWAGLAEAHTFLSVYDKNTEDHRVQAGKAAEKALQLTPDSAASRAAHGMALMISRQYSDAVIAFRRALEVNPNHFLAVYYQARCYQLKGQLQQAAALFEQAASRRPADYQAPLLALSIYRMLGNVTLAHRAAKSGLEAAGVHLMLHPDDVRAMYLGALALLELGESDQGQRWIEKAIELQPDDALVHYNAACFYTQAHNFDAALQSLSKVDQAGLAFSDWVANDPDLGPLRKDPRFDSLLRSKTGSFGKAAQASAR